MHFKTSYYEAVKKKDPDKRKAFSQNIHLHPLISTFLIINETSGVFSIVSCAYKQILPVTLAWYYESVL